MNVFQTIIDWSEVWALLIPLTIILFYRPKGYKIGLLTSYVLIALALNILITIIANFNNIMPPWLKNNNIFYNIHSIVRVLLLGFYIVTVRSSQFNVIIKTLFAIYIAFIVANFIFLEPLLFLSPNLFAAESILLLILCLNYFFQSFVDESQTFWLKQPSFLVCTGVSLYEVITFFVFLFFNTINYSTQYKDKQFARVLLMIYAFSFIILCILLALALNRSRTSTESRFARK